MTITKVFDYLGAQDKSKKGSAASKLVRPSSKFLGALVKELGWQVLALATGSSPRKLMPRLKMIFRFTVHVHRFARFNGDLAAAKYLKAALLATQRCLAGQPVSSLRELEPDLPLCRLATCGLPKIIGTHDRRLILRGNQATITLWVSLLSLYRVFDAPVKAKVSTITEPFNGDEGFLKGFEAFVPHGIRVFKGFISTLELPKKGLQPITKASPISKVSFMSLESSYLALVHNKLLQTLWDYIAETKNTYLWNEMTYLSSHWEKKWHNTKLSGKVAYLRMKTSIRKPFIHQVNYIPLPPGIYIYPVEALNFNHDYGFATLRNDPDNLFERLFITTASTPKELEALNSKELRAQTPLAMTSNLSVGKLSPKVEAAGKLRIFAMVDIWTQSALYPLHLWLFDILRKIPNDGTFNQEAAVERGWEKAKANSCSYGYDLSAATDRLPLSLQVVILSQFFGPKVASLWAKLLVDRDYTVSGPTAAKYGLESKYRYAVGQPMGAYSSWAMLAITHHYIVQCAAFHSGVSNGSVWFTDYELLGDDIILFNSKVASVYLAIMRGLGVEINEKKSVIDHRGRVTEFAKRTALDGKDVSAVSWGACKALKDNASRLTYALSIAVRGKRHLVPRTSAMMSKNLGMLKFLSTRIQERSLSLLMSRVLQEGFGAWRTWLPFLISKDASGWVGNRVLRFPLAFSTHVLTATALRKEVTLTAPSFQTYVYDLYRRSLEWAVRARVIRLMPRVKAQMLKYPAKWDVLVRQGLMNISSDNNFISMSKIELRVFAYSQLWKHLNTFRAASGNPEITEVWQPYLYGADNADHPVLGTEACLRAAIEDTFFDVTVVQTLPLDTCYRMLEVLENLSTVSAYPSQVLDKLHRKTREVKIDQSTLAVKVLAELRALRASSPYGMGPIGYKVWPRWGGKGMKREVSKVA